MKEPQGGYAFGPIIGHIIGMGQALTPTRGLPASAVLDAELGKLGFKLLAVLPGTGSEADRTSQYARLWKQYAQPSATQLGLMTRTTVGGVPVRYRAEIQTIPSIRWLVVSHPGSLTGSLAWPNGWIAPDQVDQLLKLMPAGDVWYVQTSGGDVLYTSIVPDLITLLIAGPMFDFLALGAAAEAEKKRASVPLPTAAASVLG
jgi:hypothetical protein